MSKEKGTVDRFYAKSGFGFIKGKNGAKLFAHWSNITSSDKWPRLEKGEVVEYTSGEDEKGRTCALDITFEGGVEANHGDETKSLSKFRVTGVVKFFAKKGYGFISLNKAITWPSKMPAGSDIYVSREELDMAEESRVSLWKGMEVEFNVYQPDDKEKGTLAAANVTAPGGESLTFTRPERPERSEKPKKAKGAGKGKGGKKGSVGVKKTIVKTVTKVVAKGSGKSTGKAGKSVSAKGGKSTSTGGKWVQVASKGSKGRSKGKGKW